MTGAKLTPKRSPRLGPAPRRMVPVAEAPAVPVVDAGKTGIVPVPWVLRRLALLILGTGAILLISEATGTHFLRGEAFIFFVGGWWKSVLDQRTLYGAELTGWERDNSAFDDFGDRLEQNRRLQALLDIGHER